jgi:hypothetical protein
MLMSEGIIYELMDIVQNKKEVKKEKGKRNE